MSRSGSEGTPQIEDLRRQEMLTPDEVAAMLGLRGLGWGSKRIAAEFGCSRNTVFRTTFAARRGLCIRAPQLRAKRMTAPLARNDGTNRRSPALALGFHRALPAFPQIFARRPPGACERCLRAGNDHHQEKTRHLDP
jgi:hypothetical protein